MLIYEFACPKCRKIYGFLSKRLNSGRPPACPSMGGEAGGGGSGYTRDSELYDY
jgi:hypothetical protein